ncbi:SAM-dependent methyltransferase [Amycolatopsis taiwanensis]|uniref:S-adenosyl methyltransferase n=1 Tax=Amycolatopsis taiwanensis TaxID=342230 RepID=A0A9W6QYG8_9PSEU|nr:SAM-dependent methyltransferase [Amycolatopsis taiwanensis]GLY65160.1 hypothetical protein Atai01_17790 [Amycolatopsis taiwanensis]
MPLITPRQTPIGVDPTRPSIPRIQQTFLGGKDSYEADRQVMREITSAVPDAGDIPRAGRAFRDRACRFLAAQTGIGQYLDCGAGLPTAENTHQIVQASQPEARVIYVHDDPIVLAHGRALLEENEFTHMAAGDIFNPSSVLDNPVVTRHLDFSEPMVLLQVSTIPFLPDSSELSAPEIMRQYIDALAPGSYVVLSHFLDPEVPGLTEVAKKLERMLLDGPVGAGWFRPRAEIAELMAGLDIVEPNELSVPGVVVCDEWWPDGPRMIPLSKPARCVAAVVGRKP